MTKYRIIKRLNYCNELRYFIQYKSLWIWYYLNLSGFMIDPGYKSPEDAESQLNKYFNHKGLEVVKEFDVG